MEGSLYLVLTSVCLIIFVYHRLTTRRYRALAAKLPGPPTLPLIGNAHEFLGHHDDTFDRILSLHAKYGHLVRLWLGPRLVVLVTEPKDVEAILGNPKIRNRDPMICSIVENISGPSILTTADDKWKSHRRLITPLFHFRILESYVEVFGRKASILVDRLAEVADGRTFDVYDKLSMATLDSICETVIGVNMDTQMSGESDFGKSINRALELIHNRVVRPWLLLNGIYALSSNSREAAQTTKEIHSFTSKIVDNKMTEYETGKGSEAFTTTSGAKKIIPFSDMLIASSAEDVDVVLTKEEIRDEVTTVAASGLETTATTMSCALVLVAMHPKVQKELVTELREVFDGDDRAATAQDITSLHALRRVLKETLRLFPAVTLLPREILEDTKLESGHVLPAGCSAAVLSYVTHHMEAYWPDADAFVPDRWLPEASGGRHPYAFVPFSAGPRNCVGQKYAMLQMVSVLSSVLRRFEVTTQTRMEAFKKIRVSLTSRPVVGYQVQFKKRVWSECGGVDDRNNNARG